MKLFPLVAIALSLIGTGRVAEPAMPTDQQPTFRTATTLVALQVTVTHGDKLVTGLAADDFAVLEDGVRQRVSFFDSHETPLDVVLLLDVSSSMADYIEAVHDAAGAFVSRLRPQDRGAVVGFNENLKVIQPLTEDRHTVEQAIKRTQPGGTTSLRDTLYVALKEFGSRSAAIDGIRRETFVLLTDGEDNSSLISYEDVLAAARNSGANIYAIVLRLPRGVDDSPRGTTESDFEMRRLAEETGGAAFFPVNIERLRRACSSVGAELDAKYSLAYSPATPAASGERFHRIDVQVVSNSSYRARARRGYTAMPASGHE